MHFLYEQNRTSVRAEVHCFGRASDGIVSLLAHPSVLAAVENTLRTQGFDEDKAAKLALAVSEILCGSREIDSSNGSNSKDDWYSLYIHHSSDPADWLTLTLHKLEPSARDCVVKLPSEIAAELDSLIAEVDSAREAIGRLLYNPPAPSSGENLANPEDGDEDIPSSDSSHSAQSPPDTLRALRNAFRSKGVVRNDDIDDLIDQLFQATDADLFHIWRKFGADADLELWMSRKVDYLSHDFLRQQKQLSPIQLEADLPPPSVESEQDTIASPLEQVSVPPPSPNPLPCFLEACSELEAQIIFLEVEGDGALPSFTQKHSAALLCISYDMVRNCLLQARLKIAGNRRRRSPRSAQFQPPDGKLPFAFSYPELDLTIELREHSPRTTLVRLSGGERWRGRLVQLFWQWFDTNRPDEDVVESLYAWALFVSKPIRGCYYAEVIVPERLTFIPYFAYMLPKHMQP
ncbi:MAG: hypothetical protein NZM28_08665, partial [Fimbriimonadales bacterium]|nr:hypothetical protein [Fimbriimonadales bacterium]